MKKRLALPILLSGCVAGSTVGGTSAGSNGNSSGGAASAQAELTVGAATGPAGTSVSLPLNLKNAGSAAISSLTVEARYDAKAITFLPNASEAGGQLLAAGKSLTATTPVAGVLRLIIFGLNDKPISDGTLAQLAFSIDNAASVGTVDVGEMKASASDPRAQPVQLTLQSGALHVTP
jgi:hypothetical protein